MTSVLDTPATTDFEKRPWDRTIELLFREARRRERQRRIRKFFLAMSVTGVVACAMAWGVIAAGSSASKHDATPSIVTTHVVKVLTCSGATVARPSTLVVACADANTSLTSTRWSSWNATGATGTTRFALNLCKPYCAASKMTYFPHSSVVLSAPQTSRHGTYFSRLVVHYTEGSTPETFAFTWRSESSR